LERDPLEERRDSRMRKYIGKEGVLKRKPSLLLLIFEQFNLWKKRD